MKCHNHDAGLGCVTFITIASVNSSIVSYSQWELSSMVSFTFKSTTAMAKLQFSRVIHLQHNACKTLFYDSIVVARVLLDSCQDVLSGYKCLTIQFIGRFGCLLECCIVGPH